MSTELRRRIHEFTDEYLLEQFTRRRNEYTPEALEMIAEEIRQRGLDEKQTAAMHSSAEAAAGSKQLSFGPDDFVLLEEPFSRTDLLIADAILREEGVPFFVDASGSSAALPLETESSPHYTIHLHRDYLDKAHELINAHFHLVEGRYISKYAGVRDRLKAFGFHEMRFTETMLEEMVDISFTPTERHAIRDYVRRLMEEADAVEERTGRVLFYYDNLQDVAGKLAEGIQAPLTRADLLTILETLQVYCSEDQYPQSLDSVAEGLLSFLQT